MSRSRSYCFTINNPVLGDLVDLVLLSDYTKYLIVGDEKGQKGTPHLQCYCYFTNRLSFSSFKKHFSRSPHIEAAKGSPQDNKNYCSKDGVYWEVGTCPQQGKITYEQLEEVMQDPKNNIQLYTQYRHAYRDIQNNEVKDHERILIVSSIQLETLLYGKFKSVCLNAWDEVYNTEEAVFLSPYTSFPIFHWQQGMIHKIKRGYEILPLDPRVVIIFYSNEKERNHIKNKYIHIVDQWCSNEEDVELLEGEPEAELVEEMY